MSLEMNFVVEGNDFSPHCEISLKPMTDSKAQIPYPDDESRGNENEEIGKELSVNNVQNQSQTFKAFSRFHQANHYSFGQSSLPGSFDISDDETEEPSFPLAVLKVRKRSVDWTDTLLTVAESTVSSSDDVVSRDISISAPELDSVMYDLQYGIKESLKKLPSIPKRDLLMTDFSEVEVSSFQRQRDPGSNSNFAFRVYAPVAFCFFRELFGISTEDFQESVCGAPLVDCDPSSRSGSRFFLTYDDRFILKTVRKAEAKFLIELFPGYYLNLTQHTKTLLPKFYGLYCYENGIKDIRVLIMNNILPRSYRFKEKFDLKGSTYTKRRGYNKAFDKDDLINVTLKDLDFRERWPEGFYLHHEIHKALIRAVERDCKVLQSYNIMDYSLLLGVVVPDDVNVPVKSSKMKTSKFSELFRKNRNLIGPFEARTVKGGTVYLFIGIIDILQSYTWKKKLELYFRSIFYKRDTISVNRPDFYSQRFLGFLKDFVFKSIPNLVPSSKRGCCIDAQKEWLR